MKILANARKFSNLQRFSLIFTDLYRSIQSEARFSSIKQGKSRKIK